MPFVGESGACGRSLHRKLVSRRALRRDPPHRAAAGFICRMLRDAIPEAEDGTS